MRRLREEKGKRGNDYKGRYEIDFGDQNNSVRGPTHSGYSQEGMLQNKNEDNGIEDYSEQYGEDYEEDYGTKYGEEEERQASRSRAADRLGSQAEYEREGSGEIV